jgi:hypothetical protein
VPDPQPVKAEQQKQGKMPGEITRYSMLTRLTAGFFCSLTLALATWNEGLSAQNNLMLLNFKTLNNEVFD